MAAALEDKMTLTFRNEMNEMKNMMDAFVLLPFRLARGRKGVLLVVWLRSQATGALLTHPPDSGPLTNDTMAKPRVLRAQDIQPPVNQKSHDPVKPASNPISPELSSAQVDNSLPSKEPSKKTHLPYPQRMKAQKPKEKNDMQLHKFLEMFQKLHFNISLVAFLKEHGLNACPRGRASDRDGFWKRIVLNGVLRVVKTRGFTFIPNKELDKEDLIPIPRESKIGKECDFPLCDDFQSFKTFSNPFFEKKDGFPSRNDESILKEEVHKETLKSYLNPLFEDDEEIISIEVSRQISPKVNSEPSIESLPKDDFDNDDDLFEMDSNNDEWKRILYGEDC
ncbi:hypothetical protein Tco_0423983 [Tanacetum coccineum]